MLSTIISYSISTLYTHVLTVLVLIYKKLYAGENIFFWHGIKLSLWRLFSNSLRERSSLLNSYKTFMLFFNNEPELHKRYNSALLINKQWECAIL